MSEKKVLYKCIDCGKEVENMDPGNMPECCGKRMELAHAPRCIHPMTPETDRSYYDDDPCDDDTGHN